MPSVARLRSNLAPNSTGTMTLPRTIGRSHSWLMLTMRSGTECTLWSYMYFCCPYIFRIVRNFGMSFCSGQSPPAWTVPIIQCRGIHTQATYRLLPTPSLPYVSCIWRMLDTLSWPAFYNNSTATDCNIHRGVWSWPRSIPSWKGRTRSPP